jgi:hypothetical protein
MAAELSALKGARSLHSFAPLISVGFPPGARLPHPLLTGSERRHRSMCLDDPSPRSPCEKKKELGCGTAKALEPLSLLRGHGRFKRPYILRWARPILPEGFVLTRPPPKALCPPVPAQSHPPTGELNTSSNPAPFSARPNVLLLGHASCHGCVQLSPYRQPKVCSVGFLVSTKPVCSDAETRPINDCFR